MRQRKKNRSLPACMHVSHGKYYLVKKNKWIPLSRDYAEALNKYAKLTAPSKNQGLDELIGRTLEALRERKKPPTDSTMKQYEYCARKIKTAFQDGSPQTTKPRHIAAFMDHHRKTPRMANQARALLSLAFDNAVRWGMVDYNPVSSIKPFDVDGRERYLDDAEYLAIRAEAPDYLKLMMDLAYMTGQRVTDIINIKRSDIDGDTIRFKQKKTGNRVTVTADGLGDVVQAALALRTVAAFTLFHQGGKPYSYRTVRIAFKEARERAGVEDAQFRDIRAKSATDAESDGLNASLLLGHSNPKTTEQYLRKKRTIKAQGLRVLGSS